MQGSERARNEGRTRASPMPKRPSRCAKRLQRKASMKRDRAGAIRRLRTMDRLCAMRLALPLHAGRSEPPGAAHGAPSTPAPLRPRSRRLHGRGSSRQRRRAGKGNRAAPLAAPTRSRSSKALKEPTPSRALGSSKRNGAPGEKGPPSAAALGRADRCANPFRRAGVLRHRRLAVRPRRQEGGETQSNSSTASGLCSKAFANEAHLT